MSEPRIKKPEVGFVFTVDLDLGPDGSLRGMRTGLASINLDGVPREVLERIGVKFLKVVEHEMFVEAHIDVRDLLTPRA